MMLRSAVLVGIVAGVGGCSPIGPSQTRSYRVDLEREETIVVRGTDYVTNRRGVAVDESDLVPIGTATLAHTAVVDSSVWALPGIDPSRLVVLRTPPGFAEPGWNVGDFIYFTRRGIVGTVAEACQYYADPTPGCANIGASPRPT